MEKFFMETIFEDISGSMAFHFILRVYFRADCYNMRFKKLFFRQHVLSIFIDVLFDQGSLLPAGRFRTFFNGQFISQCLIMDNLFGIEIIYRPFIIQLNKNSGKKVSADRHDYFNADCSSIFSGSI